MITLRTYGTDNNPAGTSPFVSIPVPVGTTDGDLAVACVSFPEGVTVTAPEGWTEAVVTNPAPSTCGLAVYYRIVLNAPDRWTFELSDDVEAVGGVVIYTGVDSFTSVEAVVAVDTATTETDLAAGPSATSIGNEEAVLFAVAPDTAGFTTPTGYTDVLTKSNGSANEFAAFRRSYEAASAIPSFDITYGSAVGGTTALLILRPSQGTRTVLDVFRRIIGLFPDGVEDVYDLTTTGDYYKLFVSIAEVFKAYAFDLVDILRSEFIASRSWYKLPDWERLFGLTLTRTTLTGTVPQRQAQIKSSWRAAAGQGTSKAEVQAVIAPLLGYSNSADLEIIACERPALTLLHTYGFTGDFSVSGSGGVQNTTILVDRDGGVVSSGGAQLFLAFDRADLEDITIRLTAPDGVTYQEWTGDWQTSTIQLWAKDVVGADIYGNWILTITNNAALSILVYAGNCLFVEGVQVGQETAAAIFNWGVYADSAHLGENGTPADIEAAHRQLQKMRRAHTVGKIITSIEAIPDTDGAIPDRCIPS